MRGLAALAVAAAIALAGCSAGTTSGHGTASRTARDPSSSSAPTQQPTSSAAPPGCAGACFTEPRTVAAVLAAARTDLTTAESYDYRSLGHDLAAALAVTTGEYRQQFRRAFTAVVESQARRRHIIQSVRVAGAGIETLSADSRTATVLVAATLHVTGTSVDRVDPVQAQLTLESVGGRWLISALSTPAPAATTARVDPPGSTELRDAQAAGDREMAAIGTFSHAAFARDLHRAVAGTTGAFRAALLRHGAELRRQARAPGFQFVSHVPYSAVATASGREVTIVAVLDTVRGTGATASDHGQVDLIEVTHVHGRWLISGGHPVSAS